MIIRAVSPIGALPWSGAVGCPRTGRWPTVSHADPAFLVSPANDRAGSEGAGWSRSPTQADGVSSAIVQTAFCFATYQCSAHEAPLLLVPRHHCTDGER